MRKNKQTEPVNPFSIPRFVAPEVTNAALEVLGVDATNGTFQARVYDPLHVSDRDHGSIIELDINDYWVEVELAPVLFVPKTRK